MSEDGDHLGAQVAELILKFSLHVTQTSRPITLWHCTCALIRLVRIYRCFVLQFSMRPSYISCQVTPRPTLFRQATFIILHRLNSKWLQRHYRFYRPNLDGKVNYNSLNNWLYILPSLLNNSVEYPASISQRISFDICNRLTSYILLIKMYCTGWCIEPTGHK
jgi:hypothetical protein